MVKPETGQAKRSENSSRSWVSFFDLLALAAEVAVRTGIGNVEPLTWHAEVVQADQGRPDLEAQLADGVPVVKIEAKLGAELTANQLLSYQADLQCRNSGPGWSA